MNNINIKTASPKKVFKSAFKNERFSHKHGKCAKVKAHSENVCKICKNIISHPEMSTIKVDDKLLKKAAYLHDIGKAYRKGDAHPFMSVICMYDIFDCSGEEGKMYAWKLGQIIIAHKGDFCPPEDVAVEAAILRMADKIDKYNKSKYSLEKAEKSCKKILKKIKKYFHDNGLDDKFKQIKTACEDERKEATDKRYLNLFLCS